MFRTSDSIGKHRMLKGIDMDYKRQSCLDDSKYRFNIIEEVFGLAICVICLFVLTNLLLLVLVTGGRIGPVWLLRGLYDGGFYGDNCNDCIHDYGPSIIETHWKQIWIATKLLESMRLRMQ